MLLNGLCRIWPDDFQNVALNCFVVGAQGSVIALRIYAQLREANGFGRRLVELEVSQNENKCVDISACGRIFEVTNGQFPLGPGQSPRVGFLSLPFKCYVGDCSQPLPSISLGLKTAKEPKFGAKTREVEENAEQRPCNLCLNTSRIP